MSLLAPLRRAYKDREGRITGFERTRLQWARTDAIDPKLTPALRYWNMARQRYCPRLTRYRNPLRVSADPVAKPAAQTRAESRVLDLRRRLRERDRLSAGGRWIRTSGTAAQKPQCPAI